MEPRRRPEARWNPSFAAAFWAGALALAGASAPLALWRIELARAEGLTLELVERSAAAARLRDALRQPGPEPQTLELLIGQLGGLAQPTPRRPGIPIGSTAIPVLLTAVAAAIWVRFRWSWPLADLEWAVAEFGPLPAPRGPGALRSLTRALEARLADAHRREARLESAWREGLRALAGEVGVSSLEPKVRADVEALSASRLEREGAREEALGRIVSAHRAARAAGVELARWARILEVRWSTCSDAAERADARLRTVGVRVETRKTEERERVRRLRGAAVALEQGLARAALRAEALSEQANRAVDAAALAMERAARVARGGHAVPVEAPPLDQWARELEATARQLRELIERLSLPKALEAAAPTDFEAEALEALLGSAESTRVALEGVPALLGAVSGWARDHESDLRSAWARVRPHAAAGGGPGDAELSTTLRALDAAADSARTRLEALWTRSERLLQAARG